MEKPEVNREKCMGCSGCFAVCPAGAIEFDGKAFIMQEKCRSCYICVNYCPIGAIEKGVRE